MKNDDWLTCFLFAHSRMTVPDGRLLYAYKCDDEKYIELKEQLIGQLHYLDNKVASVTKFPYFFCLYAAETFCREHDKGAWSWDTVFEPLGIDTPQQSVIANWVVKELDWWCRKLIFGSM